MSAKELKSTMLMGKEEQDPWVTSSGSSLVFYSLVSKRGEEQLSGSEETPVFTVPWSWELL